MKQIFLLTSMLLLLFSSCKKDKDSSSSIVGTWELRETTGGLLPPAGGPHYVPGNGNIVKFTDSTYEFYSSGQLTSNGSYTKSRGISPATGQLMDELTLNQGYKVYYKIEKDTMTMYIGIIPADGVINKYVRQ